MMITKKVCPQCGSEDVALVGSNSRQWMCKSCGFTGNTFVDKEIIGRDGDIK
jgi:transposase-like protein